MPVGQSEPSPLAQSTSIEAAALHTADLVKNLPASENKRFYPALDGLRAVAVLMIFYQHYLSFHPGLGWGWTGVDFFFVLSAFSSPAFSTTLATPRIGSATSMFVAPCVSSLSTMRCFSSLFYSTPSSTGSGILPGICGLCI
jgi:hypothetical protein